MSTTPRRWTRLLLAVLAAGAVACGSPSQRPGASAPVAKSSAAPCVAAPVAAPAAAAIDATALEKQGHERWKSKDYAAAATLLSRAWEAGSRTQRVPFYAACAAARTGDITTAFMWLDRAVDVGLDDASWVESAPDLAAVRADARFAPWSVRFREHAEQQAIARHVGEGLDPSTPDAEGIDPAALQNLVREAEKASSSALVVVHDGKLVGRWYFGGTPHRIEAMSATKSIVALAVAAAIDDGKIESLDTPVWKWFPEWRQGRKQKITLRMLLNHTSGLPAEDSSVIYRSPDFVQLALAAELAHEPGTHLAYNNSAVNLLPEIVARATGTPYPTFVRERLFGRMGIVDVYFSEDTAGHAQGMAGLGVQALDLAKIGQMVLDGGTWKGQRVVSRALLDELTRPAQPYDARLGLLWWIKYTTNTRRLEPGSLRAAAKHGASPEVIAKLLPLEGRELSSNELSGAMRAATGTSAELDKLLEALQTAGRLPKKTSRDPYGFEAQGSLGQYLVVVPKSRLVAVRMIDSVVGEAHPDSGLEAFGDLVRALVKK
ncbi:MAG: serine hydrolase [Deltaproteobacteria bacterium]|nr:serine hydrolase [Deltaproteobacteria bacterium]